MATQIIEQGKVISQKLAKIRSFQTDIWQPVPEVVDHDVQINREVINEDLKENQIRITITASEQFKKIDASYVKYHL